MRLRAHYDGTLVDAAGAILGTLDDVVHGRLVGVHLHVNTIAERRWDARQQGIERAAGLHVRRRSA